VLLKSPKSKTDISSAVESPSPPEPAPQPIAQRTLNRAFSRPIAGWQLVNLILIPSCFLPNVGAVCFPLMAIFLWGSPKMLQDTQRPEVGRSDLAHWFLLVWLLGLFLATPLYHPYLRLTVPVLLASFLGSGWFLQMALQRSRLTKEKGPDTPFRPVNSSAAEFGHPALTVLAALAVLLISMAIGVVGNTSRLSCLVRRSDLKDVAEEIKKQIENVHPSRAIESAPAVVYVFAEPALLFQLRLAGLNLVAPAGSLKFAESRTGKSANPVYLAIGIHAKQDQAFLEQFARLKNRLQPVGHWPWHLSPLVRLDQPGSEPGRRDPDPADFNEVELFEVVDE
jgi:HAMP domain-containing protein